MQLLNSNYSYNTKFMKHLTNMSMNTSLFVLTTKPSTFVNLLIFRANPNEQSFLGSKSRFYKNIISSSRPGRQRRRILTIGSSIQPVPPPTKPTPISSSLPPAGFRGPGWVAGAVLVLFLPFLRNKWRPLLFFKREIDQKLQTVEDVAEGLEKLADRVEHIAEDVGKNLPEGALKRAANLVEDAAEKLELAAHITDTAIDQFQELEDEVESFVELHGSHSHKTKAVELIEEKITNNEAAS